MITDDDPKARSTARAHRAHSWQTRLFVSKDALPELPHLVGADNRLRIVLRLLSAPRRHLSGKFLGRWLPRANHESGMIWEGTALGATRPRVGRLHGISAFGCLRSARFLNICSEVVAITRLAGTASCFLEAFLLAAAALSSR